MQRFVEDEEKARWYAKKKEGKEKTKIRIYLLFNYELKSTYIKSFGDAKSE